MRKIAVVNSKSFGVYFPEHISTLQDCGVVDFFDLDSEIASAELAECLKDYEYIVASVTPNYDKEFFQNSPNLKLIARHGLGFNNVDIEAATAHGVAVTKVRGDIEQEAVAELTIGLVLDLARNIKQADRSIRSEDWSERSKYWGIELKESTVGVIGYGNIGSRVGEILSEGFNSKVLVYDPYKSLETVEANKGEKVELSQLLTEADIIVINASANQENFHLLSKDQIEAMKNNVLIVNTGRGNLIDQSALVDGLSSGKIGGYAADVYEVEPIEEDNPLLEYHNVVLTPHIGAYTDESLRGMGEKMVEDIIKVISGEVPEELINKEVTER